MKTGANSEAYTTGSSKAGGNSTATTGVGDTVGSATLATVPEGTGVATDTVPDELLLGRSSGISEVPSPENSAIDIEVGEGERLDTSAAVYAVQVKQECVE